MHAADSEVGLPLICTLGTSVVLYLLISLHILAHTNSSASPRLRSPPIDTFIEASSVIDSTPDVIQNVAISTTNKAIEQIKPTPSVSLQPSVITTSKVSLNIEHTHPGVPNGIVQLFDYRNWISPYLYPNISDYTYDFMAVKHKAREEWGKELVSEVAENLPLHKVIWIAALVKNEQHFAKYMAHQIKSPYVLLAGKNDKEFRPWKFNKYLKGAESKICKIYSRNMASDEEKYVALPVGMGQEFWNDEIFVAHALEALIKENWIKPKEKKNQIFIAWADKTSLSGLRSDLRRIMCPLDTFICKEDDSPESTLTKRNDSDIIGYFKQLETFRYVLSPPGEGYDCFRTWEALFLRSIPIVQRDLVKSSVFENLPVWIYDDLMEVEKLTHDDLNEHWNAIDWDSYEWDRLTRQYWENRIRADAEKCV